VGTEHYAVELRHVRELVGGTPSGTDVSAQARMCGVPRENL
jgi:hypothetical protein